MRCSDNRFLSSPLLCQHVEKHHILPEYPLGDFEAVVATSFEGKKVGAHFGHVQADLEPAMFPGYTTLMYNIDVLQFAMFRVYIVTKTYPLRTSKRRMCGQFVPIPCRFFLVGHHMLPGMSFRYHHARFQSSGVSQPLKF